MNFLLVLRSFSLLATSLAMGGPNVLLICVDDLRPELRCYGKDYIDSPNIDALAERGVLFENHFVQAPTCGASRYAMLMGRYGPSGNDALFKRAREMKKGEQQEKSLPEWFRERGYTTVSVGKVSHHPGGFGGKDWDDEEQLEMPEAWDRSVSPAGPWKHPRGWMHGLANGEIRKNAQDMDLFQAERGRDDIYPDGVMIPVAVEQLGKLAGGEKPFFLAVGILRPHLPFGVPKQYLDIYGGVELPPVPHPEKPKGKTTWHGSGEFMKYNRWGKNPNEDTAFADEVRRHYAACVSYADAMVGKILRALDESGEAENTVVVLWGDHGWHLGEHAVWGKHTLFEESLRSPLIVVDPNQSSKGKSGAIVQSVDIFPTLCELAGLDVPLGLSGNSVHSLLETPGNGKSPGYAVSYHGGKMTIRTESFRLIKHSNDKHELYRHGGGEGGETENLADSMPEVVARLRAKLKTALR